MSIKVDGKEISMYDYQNDYSWGFNCTCGVHKTYGKETNIPHSDWCNLYRAPKDKLDCNCGKGSWHSPGCINRPDYKKKSKEGDK